MIVLTLLWGCLGTWTEREFVEDPRGDYDGDGYSEVDGDCDDAEARAVPGGIEVCDAVDNNCDGDIDESAAADVVTWYPDSDADGYGVSGPGITACAAPANYAAADGDCDDGNAFISPGAQETCSGYDEDCDGLFDTDDPTMDGLASWYLDADGDGYGDPNVVVENCEQPAGYAFSGDDCDDRNADAYPGRRESCDGADNDCDGLLDDADPDATEFLTWYRDADDDGYGTPDETAESCSPPAGFVEESTDCDDGNADIAPDAAEVCNEADDDCDGNVDELVTEDFYLDADGDGFGSVEVTAFACSAPNGFVTDFSDCDDDSAVSNPDALELCDGEDNDCDGYSDEDDAADAYIWYADADEDGFGDPERATNSCQQPDGYISDDSDCDDGRGGVNPGGTETCATGYDDNCDGGSNDPNATGCTDYFGDLDEDGYGFGASICQCVAEATYTSHVDTDCDDADGNINTGERESCATAADDNCDGDTNDVSASGCTYWYYDWDGDGYGVDSDRTCQCEEEGYYSGAVDGDCDDGAFAINPAGTEICDGLDNDCSGYVDGDDATDAATWFRDADVDGHGSLEDTDVECEQPTGFVSTATDCDDGRSNVKPGATETCSTTYDDDCDGNSNEQNAANCVDYFGDVDNDGFGAGAASCQCVADSTYTSLVDTDCADTDGNVNTGERENCATPGDDNCDGDTNDVSASGCTFWYYDWDGDGYGLDSDRSCQCEGEGYYTGAVDGDCDDDTFVVNPVGTEICDGLDNDCSGYVDGDDATDATTWYRDADADGYGSVADTDVECDQPVGFVSTGTDCDDGRSNVKPGATETCSTTYDDDCDDNDNDAGATGCSTYYLDSDADGFGVSTSLCLCTDEGAYTSRSRTDCDDTTSARSPGNTELCSTATLDDDCDSSTNDVGATGCTDYFYDYDGDGYGTASSQCTCISSGSYGATVLGDCEDTDAGVNPGVGNCGLTGDVGSADATAVTSGGAGTSVGTFSTLGLDANGDGYGDVLIGSSGYDSAYTNAGAAFIFYGPVSGSMRLDSSSNADVIFSPQYAAAEAGVSSSAGDVDGNGTDEILVVSYGRTSAWLIPGDSVGTFTESSATTTFTELKQPRIVGDLNGDGNLDVVAADTSLYPNVFYGPFAVTESSGTSDVRLGENWYGANFLDRSQSNLSSAGDLDGDGTDDLVLAGISLGGGHGATIRFGDSVGVPRSADTTLTYSDGGSSYASTADATGDYDADGYNDLLIGEGIANVVDVYLGTISSAGTARIYRGPLPPSGTLVPIDADTVIEGDGQDDRVGWDVASAGDVDGDAVGDILLGGYQTYQRPTLFYGPLSTGTLSISTNDALFTAATYGVEAAGDTNADGFDDILVGSLYSGSIYLYLGLAN